MRAVSLFSGVGGFDLGFGRAGIETVLQAEQDPWCLEVLSRHWPQTERVTDVRDVVSGLAYGGRESDDGVRGGGRADLIYGGFPCQDVSVAGKRAGLGGERSGLWFEFERIVSELRPRWVVVENVPGLLSSNQGRDFAVILDGLGELGFDVAWAVLDAQHFGVPQRRRRVFIVASAGGGSPEQVLSLCEGCGGNPAAGRAAREDVAATLRGRSHGAGVNPPGRGGEKAYGDNLIANPLPGHDPRNDLDLETYIAAPVIAAALSAVPGTGRGFGVPELAYALAARDSKGTNTREGTNTLIPIQGVRRLTPLECERLMGWPDDHTRWTADGRVISDSHRYRMCGNGVVSTVAEWIGHRLVAVDDLQMEHRMSRM